jgi:hypothetical protein
MRTTRHRPDHRGVRTLRAPRRLHTARDEMQALMFLRREDGPHGRGREFLTIVKNDPDLGTIPLVSASGVRRSVSDVRGCDGHERAFLLPPARWGWLNATT